LYGFEVIMEQGYWLDRKRAALRSARVATVAEARLIHYELAGRYSVRAANCGVEPGAGDTGRVKDGSRPAEEGSHD
jgi:hypothetical protein